MLEDKFPSMIVLDNDGEFKPVPVPQDKQGYTASCSFHIGYPYPEESDLDDAPIDPSPSANAETQIRCETQINDDERIFHMTFTVDGLDMPKPQEDDAFARIIDATAAVSHTVVIHAPDGLDETLISLLSALVRRLIGLTGGRDDPSAMINIGLILRVPADISGTKGDDMLRDSFLTRGYEDPTKYNSLKATFNSIEVVAGLPALRASLRSRVGTVTPKVNQEWPASPPTAGVVSDVIATLRTLRTRRGMPRIGETLTLIRMTEAAEKSQGLYMNAIDDLKLPIEGEELSARHGDALAMALAPIADIYDKVGALYRPIYTSIQSNTRNRLVPTQGGVTILPDGQVVSIDSVAPESELADLCRRNLAASEALCEKAVQNALAELTSGPDGPTRAFEVYTSEAKGPSKVKYERVLLSKIATGTSRPVNASTNSALDAMNINQALADPESTDWALEDVRQAVIAIAETVKESAETTAARFNDAHTQLENAIDGVASSVRAVEGDMIEITETVQETASHIDGIVGQLDEAYGAMLSLQERQGVLESRALATEGEIGRVRTGLLQVQGPARGQPKAASPQRSDLVRQSAMQSGLDGVIERTQRMFVPVEQFNALAEQVKAMRAELDILKADKD
ncbi:hypothetical protein J8273_1873 [Carpediemonas membranifera]|uniref:Uncharacterized protein n=1 Tax=Carpediemonas membranifera TaxID=201153 RepID=A0A8J6B0R1_9EUKA|nr:hypothetical protein J8273_1873 [Carpediemonas membranifera]|eukprot:KAG9396830.1 hypothetical protein J8273_1873 [Carpediemonas membranifera]